MRTILAVTAALVCAGPARAQDTDPLLPRVWSALSLENGEDAAIAAALDELGDEAIPALCAAYRGQRPSRRESGRPRPDAADRRRLESAIERRDDVAVVAHLDRLIEESDSPRIRAHVLQVLACFGGEKEIERVVSVALGIEPAFLPMPWIERHYRHAVTTILRRAPRAHGVLARNWERLGPLLKSTSVALADTGTPTAFALLCNGLEMADPPAGCLLQAVRRMVDEHVYSLDRFHRVRLIDRLDEEDPVTADAINLLVSCRDVEVVDELVRLLGARDSRVRGAAHRGLETLTGRKLPAAAGPWNAHLDEQRAWERDRVPELARTVHSRDAAARIKALKELSGRRLFPEVVIELATLFLEDEQSATRRLAVEVLSSLDSAAAAPPLIAMLEDGDETVRARAHAALTALLGADTPGDAEALAAAFPHLRP